MMIKSIGIAVIAVILLVGCGQSIEREGEVKEGRLSVQSTEPISELIEDVEEEEGFSSNVERGLLGRLNSALRAKERLEEKLEEDPDYCERTRRTRIICSREKAKIKSSLEGFKRELESLSNERRTRRGRVIEAAISKEIAEELCEKAQAIIDGVPEGMVEVPAGSFMMGSNAGNADEQPIHEQIFESVFYIDKTEVTQEAYEECVEASECEAVTSFNVGDKKPVEQVTWYQAAAYCKWRGARLPTEREWEYAARGPSNNVYPWGNGAPDATLLNYNPNVGSTTDVGSYPTGESWVGALDMSGNVWEWTSSLYDQTTYPYPYKEDGRELTGNETSGVGAVALRGGSFLIPSFGVRAANRVGFDAGIDFISFGFRCARS